MQVVFGQRRQDRLLVGEELVQGADRRLGAAGNAVGRGRVEADAGELDGGDADIWVMDDKVRYIDEVPGLPDTDLQRVRGVPGVAWAVRLYKGQIRARLADGNSRTVILFGLDDDTLVGAPTEMVAGKLADLNQPDAVIIDKAGYEYMWPEDAEQVGSRGYQPGTDIRMN